MSQSEITENQAEQNKSHAMAGIEAHPTAPHGCFFRNDRRNPAHADLQRGITRGECRTPERIDEVNDSERKDNARTKNHENSGGQGALPFCGLTSRLVSKLIDCLFDPPTLSNIRCLQDGEDGTSSGSEARLRFHLGSKSQNAATGETTGCGRAFHHAADSQPRDHSRSAVCCPAPRKCARGSRFRRWSARRPFRFTIQHEYSNRQTLYSWLATLETQPEVRRGRKWSALDESSGSGGAIVGRQCFAGDQAESFAARKFLQCEEISLCFDSLS